MTDDTEDQDDHHKKLARTLVGRTLARQYRILELVSHGGQGLVFKGWHESLKTPVAIKVRAPRRELYADVSEDWLTGHWEQECRLGFQAISSHVARVHDYRDEGVFEFLVVEWLEGPSLALVGNRNPQPWRRACELMIQAADGVAALHRRGFLHRDIKPGNFILANDNGRERVVLIDLGFTRHLADHEPYLSHLNEPTGMAMGTLHTMAPEAIGAEPGVKRVLESVATDTYGLGVVLFFLLAGRYPFVQGDRNKLVSAIVAAAPPRLSELGIHAPPAVEALVTRCLSKDPSERPASPEALKADLQTLLQAPSRRHEQRPAILTPPTPAPSRWRIAIPVAMIGIACAALGAMFPFLRDRPAESRDILAAPDPLPSANSMPPPAPPDATAPTSIPLPSFAASPAPSVEAEPNTLLANRTTRKAKRPAPTAAPAVLEELIPVPTTRPAAPLTLKPSLVEALRRCHEAPRGRVVFTFDGALRSIDLEPLAVDELTWHRCASEVLTGVSGHGTVTLSL